MLLFTTKTDWTFKDILLSSFILEMRAKIIYSTLSNESETLNNVKNNTYRKYIYIFIQMNIIIILIFINININKQTEE